MERQKLFEKIFKEHIKVETASREIESLFGLRSLNKIDYSPYYQRNYVWDNHKATYFIESILLGTEIPPLIFFNNNDGIEVIDGRQRFETIYRFIRNEFSLTKKGLNALTQLKGSTFDSLLKSEPRIIENFYEAKLRLIEFRLVNEPPLDKVLEDQVKKEIFSRYNSSITPLKKAEIDNAIYDMLSIEQIMVKNPIKVTSNITIKSVAEILAKNEFHALPVVDLDELVGIVTTTDLLKYLLEQYELEKA